MHDLLIRTVWNLTRTDTEGDRFRRAPHRRAASTLRRAEDPLPPHFANNLFVRNDSTGLDIGAAILDLMQNVEVVKDVLY